MLKSHEKFHSSNGKRQILVVDDELINRELLQQMLQNEYEIILAENGKEALEKIREYRETLSLVLMDILMPVMTGLDVLKELHKDPEIARIPVIVVTSEQRAEVESLKLGAIDFIPKPYPALDVILARIVRTIELSEDRAIIQSTERDTLTGLYNREFFYRYGQQYDQFHKEVETDAVVININHFRLINERYGKAYGDAVLKRIGGLVKGMVGASGGIVSRQEADHFMIYCPHREDYNLILENATAVLREDPEMSNRVRLRMGIYEKADKRLDIERRFDRAKMAADTVRNNFVKSIAIYDNALHESEIYIERLLEDFEDALNARQFVVFYQPKFDIRQEIPMLASAEALVRWKHPKLGMISPGVFISLFEKNGLIQKLDQYVWRTAAAQIRDWKNRFGISIPVSVNVSRIDMYDPGLIDTFRSILTEYQLSAEELLLEITESAYTQDSDQIIDTVNQLRKLGFKIEMDDFGTGYSSLNMISSLPIDGLKLDMKFIRSAFQNGRDTRMIEIIIDIADYLAVPVIAEGVETEEQLQALRSMGCDIVQGYYFSKPVPPEEYAVFLAEKKRLSLTEQKPAEVLIDQELKLSDRTMPNTIAYALTNGFEVIYYIDATNGRYVEFSTRGKYEDLQIERSGSDFFGDTQKNIPRVIYAEDRQRVAAAMQRDTLLSKLVDNKSFTMAYRLMIEGKPVFYHLLAVRALARDNHHIVVGVSNAAEQVRRVHEVAGTHEKSKEFFAIAQALSSDFESIYYVNIHTDAYTEFTSRGAYEELQIELSGTDFFAECQKNLLTVVYPEDQALVGAALEKSALMEAIRDNQVFHVVYRLMINGNPVYYRLKIVLDEEKENIVIGVSNVDAQIRGEQELAAIRAKANRDALTGVKSKHAYMDDVERINLEIDGKTNQPFAVAVCDVNGLKLVNDTQGHQAGDQRIKEACHIICDVFKHSPVYRTGGDEFVAILRGQDYMHRDSLMAQMQEINRTHQASGEVMIACGLAKWNAEEDSRFDDVLKRADAEMYGNKSMLKESLV